MVSGKCFLNITTDDQPGRCPGVGEAEEIFAETVT
jgi:hypothetical protein